MTTRPKKPAPKRNNRERKGKTPLDPTRPIGKGNPPVETQIQQGEVRNPHGRPRKMADLQELIKDILAEEMTSQDASGRTIKMTRAIAMIRTMLIKSPSDRIALLEYAFGKVPQQVTIDFTQQIAAELHITIEEAEARVQKAAEVLVSSAEFERILTGESKVDS